MGFRGVPASCERRILDLDRSGLDSLRKFLIIMAENVNPNLRRLCSGPSCVKNAKSVLSTGKFGGRAINRAERSFLQGVIRKGPPKGKK